MSIAVPLEELPDAVAGRPFGYLLTTSDDGRPHGVALRPTWSDGNLRFDAGGRSCSNAAARPAVTVMFPPVDGDAFSLVVDGSATVAGSIVLVAPTWAVRHRPAP